MNAKTEKIRFRILVVDDDPEMRSLLNDELSDEGYEVIQAEDGSEAALKMKKESFNLLITDMRMAKGGGLELLDSAKEFNPGMPVIVITAFGDWPALMNAYEGVVFAFISKPFKMNELKAAIKKALGKA